MENFDSGKYDDIRPYTDSETKAALGRIAGAPELDAISGFLFPGQSPDNLRRLIRKLDSVDSFQTEVMASAVRTIVKRTSEGVTYGGLENAMDGKTHIIVSNHRDIILDPAIIQLILHENHAPTTEIAVGDNLISSGFIEDIFRSNRMIKVVRGGTTREKYMASRHLSEYLRNDVVSGRCSVWIAQKNGRTKDGTDRTSQGLLKMFEMSGEGDFVNDFVNLSMLPVSISYQYEPCDFLKARELYISRRGEYVKQPGEDTNSILQGVLQYKGGIHFEFNRSITEKEIADCASLGKNERYQALALVIDDKIRSSFRLWDNNYIAYDMLNGGGRFAGKYSAEAASAFRAYMEKGLSAIVGKEPYILIGELREIFLSIYAGPICF